MLKRRHLPFLNFVVYAVAFCPSDTPGIVDGAGKPRTRSVRFSLAPAQLVGIDAAISTGDSWLKLARIIRGNGTYYDIVQKHWPTFDSLVANIHNFVGMLRALNATTSRKELSQALEGLHLRPKRVRLHHSNGAMGLVKLDVTRGANFAMIDTSFSVMLVYFDRTDRKMIDVGQSLGELNEMTTEEFGNFALIVLSRYYEELKRMYDVFIITLGKPAEASVCSAPAAAAPTADVS